METYGIEKYGFNPTGRIFRNNPPGALVEKALLNGEGRLSRAGALCIETGKRTGRSPNDKYIVDTPAVHDLISWGKIMWWYISTIIMGNTAVHFIREISI